MINREPVTIKNLNQTTPLKDIEKSFRSKESKKKKKEEIDT